MGSFQFPVPREDDKTRRIPGRGLREQQRAGETGTEAVETRRRQRIGEAIMP
jgi:hypothetical protein